MDVFHPGAVEGATVWHLEHNRAKAARVPDAMGRAAYAKHGRRHGPPDGIAVHDGKCSLDAQGLVVCLGPGLERQQ